MVTSSGPRPWRPSGEPVVLGPPSAYVMLVNGQAFCLSDEAGDISPDEPARGLFVGDRRVLSRLELFVDGERIESLGVDRRDPTVSTHVGRNRMRPGGLDPLLVVRRRQLRIGLTEHIEVRNLCTDEVRCRLALAVEADYADLFAVKEGRVGLTDPSGEPDGRGRGAEEGAHGADRHPDGSLVLSWTAGGLRRETIVVASPSPTVTPQAMVWNLALPGLGQWEAEIAVDVRFDTQSDTQSDAQSGASGDAPDGAPGHPADGGADAGDAADARGDASGRLSADPADGGEPVGVGHAAAGHRSHTMGLETAASGRRWRASAPTLNSGDDALDLATEQCLDDLQALRLVDLRPRGPLDVGSDERGDLGGDLAGDRGRGRGRDGGALRERVVIAAGAPWFMALFGRDALLAATMLLPVDPRLAVDVLDVLAEHQGTEVDPDTEEQPGRILHELRFGTAASLSLGAGKAYFGSVDATPLFVVLAAEAARWGALGPDEIARLLPAVDRAIAWMDDFGDPEGLGYLSYHCFSPTGLTNQGWKDSWDGIRHADGRVAHAPLALCEVQGYAYAAYRGRADLAAMTGDEVTARRWLGRAARLAERFDADFWLPAQRRYAMALGPGGEPVDGDGSNIGHCLWTGIVAEHRAPAVAASLLAPPLFSGWGVRTLAADNGGYNPLSYHCGSVWPHDNALIVAGLRRYGFTEQAAQLALGLVDAAAAHGGHLPELFAGLDRDDVGVPVRYPTSCVPQAWSAASLFLVLRALLGLEPDGRGGLTVAPALPERIGWLRWDGVRLGDRRVRIVANGPDGHVEEPGDR